jgi:Zn-dependent protease with chaperone function
VGSGATAENGLGASSVVIIGETAIASWSDDALSGLIAREFAHVVLEHGRIAPSAAPAIIALLINLVIYLESVVTHTGPFEAGPFVFAGLGAVVWMVAIMLVAGPTLYPNEVAADELVVKRGYGRELRASVQSFPPLQPARDPLDRFIRWGYRTHPTPEERLRAIDAATASGGA